MHNISRILCQNFNSIRAELTKLSLFERWATSWVEWQVDELRINRAEEQAAHDSEEGRILRRQIQKDALDHLDESFFLYGPGIDDSVWV